MREPDATFADPRQAALYALFDDDRRDLDAYVAVIAEFDARSVLDIGCGTGCLAVRLAENGTRVFGVDSAAASRPDARDWLNWPKPSTPGTLPDGREVVTELAVDDSAYPLVSFTGSVRIDGAVLRSSSTPRFRTLAEIETDLARAGFVATEVRDAPDRPGEEYVVLAQRIS